MTFSVSKPTALPLEFLSIPLSLIILARVVGELARRMTHDQARKLIASGDSMLVIERLEKDADPVEIATAYMKLAN